MRKLISLLAVVSAFTQAAVLASVSSPAPDMLHLKVYYESLCGDSKRFMEEQLKPTWTELHDILVVDVVAYGKANDTATSDGGYTFECQHGAEECRGNMMLACAREHISSHDDYIDFSICAMVAEYPPDAGEQCAKDLNINNYAAIATCIETQEGETVLHNMGEMQRKEAPRLDYVPWMIVNGEQNQDIQAMAQYALFLLTCQEYGGEKPAACDK